MSDALKHALVIGATAAVGGALCRLLAQQGYALTLTGRKDDVLQEVATDCSLRGAASVKTVALDLLDDASVSAFLNQSDQPFDRVLMVAGSMGNEQLDDLQNIADITQVNYTAPAQLLSALAVKMAENGGGDIAVISSVAGDRGRQSNYLYGSAKAALTSFASGLRNRYAAQNVHVMTVKPGFIDTPMTFGMQSPLMVSREFVAKVVIEALDKRKNSIYVPWFWRFIMLIICSIPEFIFKRLKL